MSDIEEIFQKQDELNKRLLPGVHLLHNTEYALKFILALRQEVCELVDSLDWKWWKKGEDDWNNFQVELIDILHFLVSLFLISGMSPGDVVNGYRNKHALNNERQDKGYKDGSYQKQKECVACSYVIPNYPEVGYTTSNGWKRPIKTLKYEGVCLFCNNSGHVEDNDVSLYPEKHKPKAGDTVLLSCVSHFGTPRIDMYEHIVTDNDDTKVWRMGLCKGSQELITWKKIQ